MMSDSRPRILVVDDEEAILETMTFTFENEYEVFTSTDARRALDILDEKAPIAVVLTDQRMPNMSGVEFVTEVCRRNPATVSMILTGFSDMDAIIQAVNDGHIYAYITKPWEPEDLKQVVRRAVDHHRLTVENDRLLQNLVRSNVLLEGVMERLDQGALAVDADGVVQASNTLARQYLGQSDDPRGRSLEEVLCGECLDELRTTAFELAADEDASHADLELHLGGIALRLRVTVRHLSGPSGASLGTVVFFREISHEPQRRRFDDLVGELLEADGELREPMETAVAELRTLGDELRGSPVGSPGKDELRERSARTVTALENWLSIDDSLAREDYPDAQLLQDRMRVALARWPRPDGVPVRVRELASRVEAYYDSGENPKQRTL